MTDTHIDGAVLLGALEALDCRSAEAASVWAYRSLVEVTSVLTLVPGVTLSPIPELHAAASGPYGRILADLASLVDQRPAPERDRQISLKSTQRWARDRPDRLKLCLAAVKSDESYDRWIDWISRNQWPDHVQRHGGLFEKAFAPQIAEVLDISKGDLQRVRSSSLTAAELARLVAKANEEKSQLVRDAFTVSTLLRGRYYDQLSRRTQRHVLHHSLRTPVLKSLPSSRMRSAAVTNTAWFLSIILVAAAFSERGKNRPHAWAAGIQVARKGVASGVIDVAEKPTDEVAMRVAARTASLLNVRFHPQWLDNLLNAAVSTGIGGLASIGVTGFEAVAIGFASELLLEGASPTEHVVSRLMKREVRLKSLARLGAGRLSSDWTGGR